MILTQSVTSIATYGVAEILGRATRTPPVSYTKPVVPVLSIAGQLLSCTFEALAMGSVVHI